MGEGELYKKIREMCPPAEEVFLNEKGQEIFTQEQVEKVLDLAKQDFPFWGDELRNEYGIYNLQTTPIEKIATLLTKYDEWLKKWFGNAEEKEG